MLEGQLGILTGVVGAFVADGIVPGPLGTAYGALLHFKFLSDFQDRVATAVAEGEHWRNATEYRDYQRWIDQGGGHAAVFSTRYSRTYRGPESLIAVAT